MAARYYSLLWLTTLLLWAALWWQAIPLPAWWPLILLAGWATADAGSYIFHVILDHHVRADHSAMARGFQEHHADCLKITRESLPEILSPVMPLLLPAWLLLSAPAVLGWLSPGWALYLCTIAVGVGFGQVIHRWSHLPDPGPLVRGLQRMGLVVSARAHDAHHRPPHGSAYAIVSGWSNPLFDAVALDRRLSAVLARLGYPRVA
jgi:ubiquitin-conjugating enzyme E2 variant